MRVAQLNMTNSSHQCPSGLRQRTDFDIRTCVRNGASAGCSSIQYYSTSNFQYSRVCGKVLAYQYGDTDAFGTPRQDATFSLSSVYVDGVSLTHGEPRKHIWTFAAAASEMGVGASSCQCIYLALPLILPVLLAHSTSVILAQKHIESIPPSYFLTLCGMERAVSHQTTAVASTLLHGSTNSCHSSPLTILR